MADVTELLKSALADRYRIERELGRGGMATVYLAEDLKHHSSVALKVLSAEVAALIGPERFLQEIELTRKLTHPFILPIHDSGSAGEFLYYVTPYVEGGSLRARLEREKQLPLDDALQIAREVAEALDHAHRHDVVHRDIKPENILLEEHHAVVADFGIARALRRAGGATLTSAGVVVGTPAYMSPEQSEPNREVDGRSDLYSLGCTLYEMLAGEPPYTGATAESIVYQHLSASIPDVVSLRPAVPAGVRATLRRVLAKAPADRYETGARFIEELTRPRIPSWARRAASVTAGGVVLLVALLGTNVGGMRDQLLGRSSDAPIASVVALPSRVLADEEDAFLADAIPNTISSYLNQIGGLETKVPPTSVEFEKVGGDLGMISRAYGVEALVMSTVTAQSEHLSINLQLVEADGRRLVWSRDYDGERDNYLQLVREAAEGLRKALRPEASPVPVSKGDSQTEVLFQRGMYHSNRYNNHHQEIDFDRALRAFVQVWEFDSTRADAAAEIGWLYEFKGEASAFDSVPVGSMETWARRAIEIDANCSRAWGVLGAIGFLNNNWEEALHAALRAVSLSPRDGRAANLLGVALKLGSRRLAVDVFLVASRLDPLYTYPSTNAAGAMALLEHGEESLELIDQTIDLEPSMAGLLFDRAIILLLLDRSQEVTAMLPALEGAVADDRLEPEQYQAIQDLLFVRTADKSRWQPAIDRLLAWESGELPWQIWDHLTLLLAYRGATDAALETIAHTGSIERLPPYDWLMLSPSLQGFRGEPRFTRVAAQAQVRFEQILAILEKAREQGGLPKYLDESIVNLLADLETANRR